MKQSIIHDYRLSTSKFLKRAKSGQTLDNKEFEQKLRYAFDNDTITFEVPDFKVNESGNVYKVLENIDISFTDKQKNNHKHNINSINVLCDGLDLSSNVIVPKVDAKFKYLDVKLILEQFQQVSSKTRLFCSIYSKFIAWIQTKEFKDRIDSLIVRQESVVNNKGEYMEKYITVQPPQTFQNGTKYNMYTIAPEGPQGKTEYMKWASSQSDYNQYCTDLGTTLEFGRTTGLYIKGILLSNWNNQLMTVKPIVAFSKMALIPDMDDDCDREDFDRENYE